MMYLKYIEASKKTVATVAFNLLCVFLGKVKGLPRSRRITVQCDL